MGLRSIAPDNARPSLLNNFNEVIPPFPEDAPTVPLLVISHRKLAAGDEEEISRLWEASKTVGFFYYDLRGDGGEPKGQDVIKAADDLFGLMAPAFDLPLEEKLETTMEKNGPAMFGYKAKGITVVDKHGNRDNMEHYFLGCRDILGQSPAAADGAPYEGRKYPAVVRDAFPGPLTTYTNLCHKVSNLLLKILAQKLGVKPEVEGGESTNPLLALHAQTNDSTTHVRFIKAPPRPNITSKGNTELPSLMPHTDWGSVTILFNIIGGLQVYVPAGFDSRNPTEGWRYVRPLQGHAIINLGDAMVKFSNGLLSSNIHRVVTPPGEQKSIERYSLAYFLRPINSTIMKPLEGSGIPKDNVAEDKTEPVSYLHWMIRRAHGGVAKQNYTADDWEAAKGTERYTAARD
ncbi:hypothetical protein BDZ91DRAFT_734343 [Kalaharituber pfeilii]|nr:hypothetical protein BDZ91DRAFT_734343 [Kalaharituber pfeilii]